MVSENTVGGTLVLLALALLAASGQLEWIGVLLPVSILAGFGQVRRERRKTRLTHGLKKG